MALHFVNGIPARLSMWQRVRAYAVPPSMIETCAARRAVGDWAGACAAARVDVDLDLSAVRRRHGTLLARRVRADLRRLSPDLLRWHLPRVAPDGLLRPGLTVRLVRYGSVQLVVRTPPARADAGQRLSLALWEPGAGQPLPHHPHPHPERRFRLDLHRHLWDADHGHELAARAAADWATEGELLLRADGLGPRGLFVVRTGARGRTVVELVAPDDSHVPVCRPVRAPLAPQEAAALPVLPEAAVRVPPDLELLRAGLVTGGGLHPVVAAALAGHADHPARDRSGAQAADPHRVPCRGEVHRIALRGGVLTAVDHPPDQLRREELLMALGGPGLPCLRAIDAVHRSPEALPAVRERLLHGDAVGALAVVEGLLGPGAVLRDGPLKEELESAAAGRVGHGLFRARLDDVPAHHADPSARRGKLDRRTRTRPRVALTV
ncbi:hypothetical protein [Streptomyces sp. VRA16 Mangrove soil]|uniref:hypothetical protein n=1 Tax=Streptomyces sp. VRA16 Mangrove soil TaxID=2817434 RepID=UPI001A9FA50D|nr:hypothetical protein [Streptomyces sp. VRA16 Mangrove soil]MBO1333998.1 hypothetical protein [Streptomyces sp. VRA16 Mangrove soil]